MYVCIYLHTHLLRLQEAAAQKEREEEERRKQQQQQQKRQQQMRHGSKPWFRHMRASLDWNFSDVPPPPRGWFGDMSSWKNAWGGGNFDQRNWAHHQSRQNKSATWHAEMPPNFQQWSREDCSGGNPYRQANSHGSRANEYRGNPDNLQGRNKSGWEGGSSRDSRFHWRSSKEPAQAGQQAETSRNLPNKSLKSFKSLQSLVNQKQDGPRKGYQSRESSSGERGPGNKGPGAPKIDKQYRWAPYPPSLLDLQPSAVENNPGYGGQLPEWHPKSGRQSRQHPPSEPPNTKDQDSRRRRPGLNQNSSGSTSSESPSTTSTSNSKKAERPAEHTDKAPPPSSPRTNLSRASSQDSVHLRASSKLQESGTSKSRSRNSASTAEEERLLSDMLKRAKETFLDKKPAANPWMSKEQGAGTPPHLQELDECMPSPKSDKANQSRGKSAKSQDELPADDGHCAVDQSSPGTRYASSQTDSLSLQSVLVSTSTADREDEEEMKKEEEENIIPAAQDSTHATLNPHEEGFSSDGNTQKEDASAQVNADGYATVPSLSKLALPACLKRDLGRHIGTKGKAALGHEPNLNSARRIRNVTSPRRSESEKDSSLTPIVRELISSTGTRRNVNWNQVYQEVSRKKQEKGKGLPRYIQWLVLFTVDLQLQGWKMCLYKCVSFTNHSLSALQH